MANIKIIDLPTGSPESTSFVEATQVDELAESGRSTVKLALNALGNFVAGQGASPLEYGDLETESTTLIGGINELHGVDGYDVYDETRTSSNKYVQGDICIHSNSLQVCTDANGAYGAWDSTKWSPTTIKALLALKQNATDNSLDTTNKTVVGAINELNTLSEVSFSSNTKLTSNGINVVKHGKFILIVGVFRGTTLNANETIFQLNNVNIVSAVTTVFISINGNFGTNYVGYLKCENSGTGIKIFTDVALDNPSLIFVNGIIPIK